MSRRQLQFQGFVPDVRYQALFGTEEITVMSTAPKNLNGAWQKLVDKTELGYDSLGVAYDPFLSPR